MTSEERYYKINEMENLCNALSCNKCNAKDICESGKNWRYVCDDDIQKIYDKLSGK